MSESKAWLRRDDSNSCIRPCYVKERWIKELDERWGRVRGVETHEGVVRTPLSVVCAHDIVIEGVNILILLTISSRELSRNILQHLRAR